MNERIRELAERATDKWLGGEFFDREKFARLIVTECIEICDSKRIEYTKLCKDAASFEKKNIYAEGEISAHQIRLLIQKHFGVSE
jgi:hypothetical protein